MSPTEPSKPVIIAEKHPRFITYLTVVLSLCLIFINFLFIHTNQPMGSGLFQAMTLWVSLQLVFFGLPLMVACIVLVVQAISHKDVISRAFFTVRMGFTSAALVSSVAALVFGLFLIL